MHGMRQGRRIRNPRMDGRLATGNRPRAAYAATRAAGQGQRRHVVARTLRRHRRVRIPAGLRIPAPHKGRTTARHAPGRLFDPLHPARANFKSPGDLGHPRAVLPGFHDGGRSAADELPGTAVSERTVPRVRAERMAAVAGRWPFRIEGFEYEPGYVYRLRIGTSVVPAPDSPAGYYSIRYSMLDMDRQPAED